MDATHDPVAALFGRAATHNIRIGAVCRLAGVAPSTISRWRGGAFEPKHKTLRKLSDALEQLIRDKAGPRPMHPGDLAQAL